MQIAKRINATDKINLFIFKIRPHRKVKAANVILDIDRIKTLLNISF